MFEKTSTGAVTKYYEAFGRAVAMRDAGGTRFLLADHLGSTTGSIDAVTGAVATQRYWPYGATRSGALATDKLYTGQQQEAGADPALGLYNYNARFYSTTLGRFVSPDPIVAGGHDPQAWNAYTYVRGNPLRHTDPTGMCFSGGCGGLGAALAPAVDSLVSQVGGYFQDLVVGLYLYNLAYPSLQQQEEMAWSYWSYVQPAPPRVTKINWLGVGHVLLGVTGFVPLVGPFADVLDGIIYGLEGDTTGLILSLGSAIPVGGDAEGAGRFARYTDDVVGLGKLGKSDTVVNVHHLLPRQFTPQFERAGLNIENYTTVIPREYHLDIHGRGGGELWFNSWNKQWERFFARNPSPESADILAQLDQMKRTFGLQ